MKLIIKPLIIVFSILLVTSPAFSVVVPSTSGKIIPVELLNKKITSLKVRDIQKITGKKLSLKERIGFGILKYKLRHAKNEKSNQGQLAFTLGLVSLGLLVIGLFVPFVIIGALVTSILAIVFGSMAKKSDPSDKKAHAGKLLGWITLGLIALLLLAAVVIVASWGWY